MRAPFLQALIAVCVFTTPVLVVLYILTVPNGAWRFVLSVHVIGAVLVTVGAVLFFRTGIWVDANGLRERGFFGRISYVPVADIGLIIVADTFTGVASEATPQLFVCDRDGTQLIRMRGAFWSQQSMDVVVATLDVPHTHLGDAVQQSELRDGYPGLLYWFERRPVLAAFVFTAAIAAAAGITLLVLNLLGISG